MAAEDTTWLQGTCRGSTSPSWTSFGQFAWLPGRKGGGCTIVLLVGSKGGGCTTPAVLAGSEKDGCTIVLLVGSEEGDGCTVWERGRRLYDCGAAG